MLVTLTPTTSVQTMHQALWLPTSVWIVPDHKLAVSYVSNKIWRAYVFNHD